MGKYCVYRTCKNYSISAVSVACGIKFFAIPKLTNNVEKCLAWVSAVNRDDILTNSVKPYHYVCSKHFIGGNGPTEEHPNPIKEPEQNRIHLEHNYQIPITTGIIEKNQALASHIDVETIERPQALESPPKDLETFKRPQALESPPEDLETFERPQALESPLKDLETFKRPQALESPPKDLEAIERPLESPIIATEVIEVPEVLDFSGKFETIEEHFQRDESLAVIDDTNLVHPLKKLAQEFLQFWLNHFDTWDWSVEIIKESTSHVSVLKSLSFKKIGDNYLRIEIPLSLKPSIYFCNSLISPSHEIFSSNSIDFNICILSSKELINFLFEIENWKACEGVQGDLFSIFKDKYLKTSYICVTSQSIRSKDCQQLFLGKRLCHNCQITKNVLQTRKRKETTGLPKNINHRFMNKEQLKEKLVIMKKKLVTMNKTKYKEKLVIMKKKQIALNKRIKRIKVLEIKIKKSFKKNGVFMTEEESRDFEDIILKNPFESKSVFFKLLMKEQLKLIMTKKSKPRKWHPAIMQWCISIKARSSSTYDAVRKVLVLPSQRSLFNYPVDLNTRSGFNDKVLLEMRERIDVENLEEHQKYFSLIIDEIQIKQDLVYKNSTGELIGGTNLNTFGNKATEMENCINGLSDDGDINLANHVLQLMVRGITTNFKYPYAFFPCGNLHAEDLYSILWEAVENLQAAGFKILSLVCDKATSNRKLIKICTEADRKLNNRKIGYCTPNPFNNEEPLFFVSDICHNIKTARNALSNSGKFQKQKDGSMKLIRVLKKNGKSILWKHISDAYEIDSSSLPRLAPKLTYNHIHPNALSCMKVRLATQILSSSTANAVEELVGEEASETVKFLRYFDTFFDILNVSNTFAFHTKRKPALAPFRSLDDWRFKWLVDDFLGYLDEWEREVNEMVVEKEFEKTKMLLSGEALEGIRITVHSTIEIVKFLLKKGAPFVLTSKLNQDLLENYFSRQRGSCGSVENPTVNQYEQSAKRLKLMKSLMPRIKNGNCTKEKRDKKRKAVREKVNAS